MKTIVTLFIALLAFASTLAWAGSEPAEGRAAAQQVQSSPATGQAAAPAAKAANPRAEAQRGQRAAAARAMTKAGSQPATAPTSYGFELPEGQSVICACVVNKSLG